VDSSLSTAIAATLSRERIRTFTLTYDGPSSTPGKEEDRRWAKVVAERYDTDHYEERLSAESFTDGFRRILQQFDQPFAGVVSPYFLARAMARHVKVALSGDGADELFGSYLSHRLAPAIAAYLDGGRPALDLPWWTPIRDQAERIAHRDPARWRAQLHVFSETDKRSLYTAQFAEMVAGASSEEHLAGYFAGGTARDPLNAMLEAEFRGIFPDQVLAFVDRLSMAHSLETRCPFLDRDFVQLAASLPDRLKTRDGETKWILKRLALRYLPEKLVHRPKEGFVMPVNEWLRGALDAFTKEALVPERVRRAGFVQPTAVAALVERFRGGEVALANQVLSLIALHVWWEDYFGDVRTY
jgi:asparagine synthase (glutamine-hydrolysing)